MFASFLAAFFFALNATCASHSVRAVGTLRANLGRLVVAAVLLGLFAHTVGHGFASASLGWFLLSGIIGMGLGDLGVYGALPLLGSRLTVLMTQCLAAPIAALGEWLWLGTRLTTLQVIWGLVILAGVTVAIMPSKSSPPRVQVKPIGFLLGFIAACGQGFGALVSRKGVTVAAAAGEHVANATFGLNAAYHRILAGLVFTALWFVVLRLLRRTPAVPSATPAEHRPALAARQRTRRSGRGRGLLPVGARDDAQRARPAHRRHHAAAVHPYRVLAGRRPPSPPRHRRRRDRRRRLRGAHAESVRTRNRLNRQRRRTKL